MTTETEHVFDLVADYALGLQTASEHQRVEAHIARCARCRQAIAEERQLSLAVRETIRVASSPDLRRLRRLMPGPPRRFSWQFAWQRQLAPVALVLILLVGGMGLWHTNQRMLLVDPSPTALAATATTTDVPSATTAETEPAGVAAPALTAAATAPAQTLAAVTPAPIPTPSVGPAGGN